VKPGTRPAPVVHDYAFDEYGRLVVDRAAFPSGSVSDSSGAGSNSSTFDDEGQLISITSWMYYGLDSASGENEEGPRAPANPGNPAKAE